MSEVKWDEIKVEYITTDTSYRKLAQKYGVGYQAICHRSKEEGWIGLREQHKNKTLTKALSKISNKEAEKLSKIDSLADKILAKLERAIDELDVQLCSHKDKTKTIEYGNEKRPDKPTREVVHEEEKIVETKGVVDKNGLKQVASALKDIKEVKMLRSELDMREQAARVALLEAKGAESGEDTEIKIAFENPIAEAIAQ